MDFALFFVFVFLITLTLGFCGLSYIFWRIGRGEWTAIIMKRKGNGET